MIEDKSYSDAKLMVWLDKKYSSVPILLTLTIFKVCNIPQYLVFENDKVSKSNKMNIKDYKQVSSNEKVHYVV